MLVVSLVVGRGRPGSLLGYDRGDFNGPALVKWAVTSLHRHSHLVPMESVRAVDWHSGRVEVSGPVAPLRTS